MNVSNSPSQPDHAGRKPRQKNVSQAAAPIPKACLYKVTSSSISVTRAATGERSERVRVTWANSG